MIFPLLTAQIPAFSPNSLFQTAGMIFEMTIFTFEIADDQLLNLKIEGTG